MIHFPLSSDNRISSRILKYIATCWPEMLLQFENIDIWQRNIQLSKKY